MKTINLKADGALAFRVFNTKLNSDICYVIANDSTNEKQYPLYKEEDNFLKALDIYSDEKSTASIVMYLVTDVVPKGCVFINTNNFTLGITQNELKGDCYGMVIKTNLTELDTPLINFIPNELEALANFINSSLKTNENEQNNKVEAPLEYRMYGFVPYNLSEIQKGC